MVKTTKEGKVEQYDKAMPKNHWLRNKKQVVNFLHDTPFAIDRQLEDQRYTQEKNRNPQFFNPTKVDKVRSEMIIAKKGASRAVAVKANVLNKIVREASGVHNYTIVAPPRAKMPVQNSDMEILDPETNPRVKSYANEAKQQPVLCSFGHRPSSASRTFHPATMKFRLKHGEIAHNTQKTGFGLPVSILSQILHAPKISLPGAELDVEPSVAEHTSGNAAHTTEDYNDLFFSASEQQTLFRRNGNGDKKQRAVAKRERFRSEEDQQSRASWVSNDNVLAKRGNRKLEPLNHGGSSLLLPSTVEDRPSWDEAHHRIKVGSNDVYAMRMSGLNDLAQQPLADKLKRFAKLSVAESQFVPFCTEKQETDKLLLSGAVHKVPKSTPIKGSVLYYDPWDVELEEVKKYRREVDRKRLNKYAAAKYQDQLSSIPPVDYFPTTALSKMSSSSSAGNLGLTGQSQRSQISVTALSSRSSAHHGEKPHTLLSFSYPMELRPMSSTYTSSPPKTINDNDDDREDSFARPNSSYLLVENSVLDQTNHHLHSKSTISAAMHELYDADWQDLERQHKAAMRAAKRGDVNALYEFNMRQKARIPLDPLPRPLSSGKPYCEDEEEGYVPAPPDFHQQHHQQEEGQQQKHQRQQEDEQEGQDGDLENGEEEERWEDE